MEEPKSGSIYQHYKGDSYVVLHIGTHTETGDRLVVYHKLGCTTIWIRPLSMWYESVEYDGKIVKRFTLR